MAHSSLPRADENEARPRFHPPSHVMAEFAGRNLSLAARLLALVLACKARRASDGHFYIWRGRKALSALTGLSVRSVTMARKELIEAGVFLEIHRASIDTPDGIFDVAAGVPVLQLVEHPNAFITARDQARVHDRRVVDDDTRLERLEIQKAHLRGELTREACHRREADVRRRYRRERRAGVKQLHPKDSHRDDDSKCGESRAEVKQLHPMRGSSFTPGEGSSFTGRGEAASPKGPS